MRLSSLATAEPQLVKTFEGHFNRDGMECHYGSRCPYINGGDIRRLIAERNYLSQRLDEIDRVMAAAEAEIGKLRQENQKLTEENKRLTEENKSLGYQSKQMLGKIFKPQVKPAPDVNRPRRGASRGHRGNSRRRPEEISEFVDIYPNKCDRCGGTIETNYEANFDEHVVEDIEIKKRVTCYRLHYGYCKCCQQAVRAEGPVNPNDRIGIQARGVGGYLRYLGLTYGKVARLFKDVFDLNLTRPSFMAFNTEQAQNGAPPL
jgi:hypothetical protein